MKQNTIWVYNEIIYYKILMKSFKVSGGLLDMKKNKPKDI